MSSVGEQLRAGREAQGLTLNQVAEATKIRTDHLEALELGNYDVFVAPVYIKGFVRSYALLLHLDLAGLMQQLDAELRHTGKFGEPPRLTNRPRGVIDDAMLFLSRVNWGILLPFLLVLVFILVAVFGYQAYRRHKNTDPLADLGPGLYQPSPALRDLRLSVPTNPPAPRK